MGVGKLMKCHFININTNTSIPTSTITTTNTAIPTSTNTTTNTAVPSSTNTTTNTAILTVANSSARTKPLLLLPPDQLLQQLPLLLLDKQI